MPAATFIPISDNEQTESFTGSMEGSFVGIGIQFYGVDDSTFIIDEVLKNSPAEGAGFLMGDQILPLMELYAGI